RSCRSGPSAPGRSTTPPPPATAPPATTRGTLRAPPRNGPTGPAANRHDDIRSGRDQFPRVSASEARIARTPAAVDANVAAVGPAQLPQPLQERRQTGLAYRIVLGVWHEHADASHPLALLRAHRERPRRRRAAECGQQFPPSDGDCHTPLPREVRRGKNTTPRARCLHVVLREPPWTAGGQKCSQLF